MPILDGLMREVLADVNVLGPLVAANDVAPPFDAGSVVLVMLGRCTVLSKADAAKQCAQRDDLLGIVQYRHVPWQLLNEDVSGNTLTSHAFTCAIERNK